MGGQGEYRTEESDRGSLLNAWLSKPTKGPVMLESSVIRSSQLYQRLGKKITQRAAKAGWIFPAAKKGRICSWRVSDVLEVEARIALGDLPAQLPCEITCLERQKARKAAEKTASKLDAVNAASSRSEPPEGGKITGHQHEVAVSRFIPQADTEVGHRGAKASNFDAVLEGSEGTEGGAK